MTDRAADDARPAARHPARAPRLFEADAVGPAANAPHDAPPPDPAPPTADAPPTASQVARRRGWSGWVWAAAAALLGLALSVAAWDFAAQMLARNPVLGAVASVLLTVLALGLIAFALSEIAALARLSRVDGLRAAAAAAQGGARADALAVAAQVRTLYQGRADMEWALAELDRRLPDAVDGDDALTAIERIAMTPLDDRAEAEVTRAARQVAAATAMIPHAAVDALAALALNLRMARRIAAIYGGRAGWLGSLRLVRAILGHVLATGAVSLGDDLAGPALGGGAAGVVSRRLGEGVLNGALTARVGVAAIAVCRPMPFAARAQPRWRDLALATISKLT